MPADLQALRNVSLVKTGELFMASGRGGTCYNIEGYRTLTIDQFKDEVVPSLKTTETNEELKAFVIRDIYNQRLHVVWPEYVEEFHINGFKDLPQRHLIQAIKENNTRDGVEAPDDVLMLNLPVPVLEYRTTAATYSVTGKMPAQKLGYSNPTLDLETKVYLPPLAFTVVFDSKTHSATKCLISVITEDSINPALIRYGHLAFPNVYSSGDICMGSARTKEDWKDKSLAQRFMEMFSIVMTSKWNNHLLGSSPFPHNLEQLWDQHHKGVVPRLAGDSGSARHWKLIKLLEKEDMWKELKWAPKYDRS